MPEDSEQDKTISAFQFGEMLLVYPEDTIKRLFNNHKKDIYPVLLQKHSQFSNLLSSLSESQEKVALDAFSADELKSLVFMEINRTMTVCDRLRPFIRRLKGENKMYFLNRLGADDVNKMVKSSGELILLMMTFPIEKRWDFLEFLGQPKVDWLTTTFAEYDQIGGNLPENKKEQYDKLLANEKRSSFQAYNKRYQEYFMQAHIDYASNLAVFFSEAPSMFEEKTVQNIIAQDQKEVGSGKGCLVVTELFSLGKKRPQDQENTNNVEPPKKAQRKNDGARRNTRSNGIHS